ncbi:hypothetical protein GCM10010387_35410 [Streptomyces inusitatus]|uniref:Uncharacterized protein n=1 Tax=Streptomyces inusitatus TaxID=68221 RepID=A0A918UWM4_9ACTN|nr:hypothetical protein GCM10010387_35410 [Streptomyces inusitatus]
MRQQGDTAAREHNPSVQTFEQGLAQLLLQALDLLADGGLDDVAASGGLGEGSLFRDRDEVFKSPQLHANDVTKQGNTAQRLPSAPDGGKECGRAHSRPDGSGRRRGAARKGKRMISPCGGEPGQGFHWEGRGEHPGMSQKERA